MRQLLFNEVKIRFTAIRTANGYQTDIGARCFTWRDTRATPFEEQELPCFAIRDPDCETHQRVSLHHDHTLVIEVHAAATGAPPDNWARHILADLDRAIGMDRQWANPAGRKLAKDTLPGTDAIEIIHASKRIVGVRKTFQIEYRTQRFDPYNQ